jgi:hypothetical protein
MEARPPAQNRHGGAPRGARSSAEGRGTPRKRPGLPRHVQAAGAAAPERLLGAPLPVCGSKKKDQTPGGKPAAGTRDAVRS